MEPEPGNAGVGKRTKRTRPSYGGGFFAEMEITINGKPQTLETEVSLDKYLADRGLPEASVVERNGQIIPKDRRHLVVLRDGDVLEVVKLVGGG